LLDASRRLTRPSTGIYGFAALPAFRCRLPYVWQNGGELFDVAGARESGGGTCRLMADDVVESLEFWSELEQSSPLSRRTEDPACLYELFATGRLAMFPWGGRLRARAALDPACRWGVAPMPMGRCRATLLVAEAYGITRTTAEPEAALRLACELVSPESLHEQVEAGYPLVADGVVQARFPVEPAFADSLKWARVSREYRFREEMRVIEHQFRCAWRDGESVLATCRRVQGIVSSMLESRDSPASYRELY
jgi:hypothetical protein